MFSKKTIYLDNAAATPVDKQVVLAMKPYFKKMFSNPGSLHRGAVVAAQAVEQARRKAAQVLGARSSEIVFVGGGTESNNLAIVGALWGFQKSNPTVRPHIIVSAIEHKAVLTTVRNLQSLGIIDLSEISVDTEGVIDMVQFKKALQPNTVLVSVMYANNEIGTIQPIREIAKTVRHYRKHVTQTMYPLLHTDAIQAFQYCDSNVARLGVDLMSVSAAKIYGPKGIALLYVRTGVPMQPMIIGGGQEMGLRSGTENIPSIIGFVRAMEIADSMRASEEVRLQTLQTYFFDRITHEFPEAIINGSKTERLPNNCNVTFPGISGEQLVIALDAMGIAVSAQSACATDDDSSYVLQAIDLNRNTEEGGIRFSLGRHTTKKDIDKTIRALHVIIDRITTTKNILGL